MSLLHLIKKVRRQPQHVRDNIAFVTAAGFTAVIALIWVYHAPGSFTISGEKADSEANPPFFAHIRSSIAEQTATVKEAFSSTELMVSDDAEIETETVSSTPTTTFTLTEENRRALASSSANVSTTEVEQTDVRRVVRIATTTSSSSESGE